MDDLQSLGRFLLLAGVVLCIAGGLLLLGPRVPFLGALGRLPGDIVAGNDHVRVYIPIVTSIVLSLVLTILLNVLPRLFK